MSETKQPFVINGDQAEEKYFAFIRDLRKEHPYLIVKYPRFGEQRSLTANSLLHVWIRDAAAFYLSKPLDEVTDLDMDAMKISLKVHCLLDNPNFKEYLIVDLPDPMGKKCETDIGQQRYASSKHWGRDGMHHIMTWFQIRAAFDGLTLESKGKFKERQLSQTE